MVRTYKIMLEKRELTALLELGVFEWRQYRDEQAKTQMHYAIEDELRDIVNKIMTKLDSEGGRKKESDSKISIRFSSSQVYTLCIVCNSSGVLEKRIASGISDQLRLAYVERNKPVLQ